MKTLFLVIILLFPFLKGFGKTTELVHSGDAWAGYEESSQTWSLGTKQMTQELQLANGSYLLKKLRNELSATEYIDSTISGEFRFVIDGQLFSGDRGGYELVSYTSGKLKQPRTFPGDEPGVFLEVTLKNKKFSICLRYEVFASSAYTPMGMVRKYYTVTNTTNMPEDLTEISMNNLDINYKEAAKLKLHYWQGGGAGKNTNHQFINTLKWGDLTFPGQTFYSDAGAPEYRMDDPYDGTSSFHPYFVLEHDSMGGIFIGFNYLGPWSMKFWTDYQFPPDKQVQSWGLLIPTRRNLCVSSQVEKHRQVLKPGESFESPNSFTGVFTGDLDNANDQLQYWQAAYKWDYTREKYLFSGSVVNVNWSKGDSRNKPDLHFKQVFDMVNKSREMGIGIVHEDDFWFDDRGRGVWEGVDWKQIVDYAGKSGIYLKLWMPPNHFARNTPNDLQQQDWHLDPKTSPGITLWYGYGYCMGDNGAIDYMKNFLLERQKRYGAFINRFDGWFEAPCYSTQHDHAPGNPFLVQYRNTMRLFKEVKEANPEMGIEGCNSGGEWVNWDKIEFLESQQGSDGGGEDDFYNLSYFWCVPKMIVIGAPSNITEKRAPRVRENMLIQKYLNREKVVSRFMHLYHPKADGAATAHCFIELTNAERTKGVIRQDKASNGEVVVYPKALLPEMSYLIKFRYGGEEYFKKGEELMQSGIAFKDTTSAQLIFLNLNDFPGSGTDKIRPSAPSITTVKKAVFCGHEGTEIEWTKSSDDRLLAGYQLYRDGRLIDFIGLGTFYFDLSEGNGPKARYEVVAVDADGNVSSKKH